MNDVNPALPDKAYRVRVNGKYVCVDYGQSAEDVLRKVNERLGRNTKAADSNIVVTLLTD
jgi:hypothetical protein